MGFDSFNGDADRDGELILIISDMPIPPSGGGKKFSLI